MTTQPETDTLATLRDRLLALQAQRDAGTLAAAAYDAERAAVERRVGDLLLRLPLPAPQARPGARLWAVVALASGAVAIAGYLWTGTPQAVTAPAHAAAESGGVDQAQITAMVDKLAARLAAQPDDADGWAMLGRSYLVLDKLAQAADAYGQASKLRPDSAALLTDYADALAASKGHQLAGEPTQLLQRALALEPDNLKALMLAGTAAFERGEFAAAVRHWERVLAVAPADHPWLEQAARSVEQARRQATSPTSDPASAPR